MTARGLRVRPRASSKAIAAAVRQVLEEPPQGGGSSASTDGQAHLLVGER